ncbi:MAG: hypothetical protein AB7I42_29530 [Bradyrhizobium sp.]|uniref:hypothetical protein n=1 Tax=Bradyrhizobium sp. TaxID=376 RepID=UPI003D12ABA7
MGERTVLRVAITITFLSALVVLAGLVILARAQAHDAPSGWAYPNSCCGGSDCAPLRAGDLEFTSQGWKVKLTGEVIPLAAAQPSGDRQNHRCRTEPDDPRSETRCQSENGAKVCCLFIADPGI